MIAFLTHAGCFAWVIYSYYYFKFHKTNLRCIFLSFHFFMLEIPHESQLQCQQWRHSSMVYLLHPSLFGPAFHSGFFYTKTVVAMLDNFGVTCTFEFFITIGLLMAIPFSAGTYIPLLSLCGTSSLKTWLPLKLFANAKFYWKTTPFIHCPLCVHCITSITTPQTTV